MLRDGGISCGEELGYGLVVASQCRAVLTRQIHLLLGLENGATAANQEQLEQAFLPK